MLCTTKLWWDFYPTCFVPDLTEANPIRVVDTYSVYHSGSTTTFYKANIYIITIFFAIIEVLITLRRNEFHVSVYLLLSVAMGFRVITIFFGAFIVDTSSISIRIAEHLTKLLSFLYLFLAMVCNPIIILLMIIRLSPLYETQCLLCLEN